ncbi:MAG: FAD-binding oxidoreductase, partial [Endomicrobiia bacterium]
KIDRNKKTAVLQSGVVVNDFLKEIEKFGFFYPPFPTERNAFIGGNVATNASGEYSFRFGPTRKYVSRVRMVLSSGEVLEVNRGEIFEKDGILDYGIFKIQLPSYRTPEVKCSAGYYIKDKMDGIDLLIGSEGTLGVITEIEVSLIEKLPERFIIIMFFEKEEDIPFIVSKIKKQKDVLNIYSLEFFDKNSLEFLKEEYDFVSNKTCALYVEAEKERIYFWDDILKQIECKDTVVAESVSDYKKLIDLRYKLPEKINSYFKEIGSIKIAVDASVTNEKFYELYNFYKNIQKENKELKTVIFGHIGENHLHFNLFPKDENQKELALKIYIESIKKAVSLGGTGFAEHGIGKIKSKYLKYMYNEKSLFEMAKIKKTFDPYCILSLDNIFPKEYINLCKPL